MDKTLILTKLLLEAGIFVNPVVAPAVPKNDTLIRFSLIATHTHEQVDRAVDNIHRISKMLGIL
jgi:7-keto-8-aminopelargonate synthetase-like enzyme